MKVNLIRKNENTKSLCDNCSIKNKCTVYTKFGVAFDVDNCENYPLVNKTKKGKKKIKEKYKPESCAECMYHQVDGIFDYCGLDYGMMLIDDDNTDHEKQRDPKCPLN